MITTHTWPVAHLLSQFAERDRPDAGDVSSLMASIEAIGMLSPPVVTKGGKLVNGLRRVTAWAELGHTEIECLVGRTITDVDLLLRAEWDENVERRDLTPEEAARARRRRMEILKPLAEANKAATQAKPGEGRVGGGNLPPPTEPVGKVRTTAATGLGYGARTLDKVDKILDIAEDTTTPPKVREAAAAAVQDINAGKPIDPAHRKIRAMAAAKVPWTEREKTLQAALIAGQTVVVNLGTDTRLVNWAEEQDRYVRVDRKTPWGNPFVVNEDGDRDEVIANYRDCYLAHKPSLNPKDLKGKALGCWCAPDACHGDILQAQAEA